MPFRSSQGITELSVAPIVRLALACALALLALPAPAGLMAGDDPVAAAEAAARAGAEEAGGKAFAEAVGQAFGRDHAGTIQRCARETKRPDLSEFALLLRLDRTGTVDQALVKPATNLAACVQSRMTGWKVSPPPRDGFWVKVGVNLKRK
jgi:hypothetical protein